MKGLILAWRGRLQIRAREGRFWVVQGLVLAISAAHTSLEAARALAHSPDLYLLPISTYFIPVLYAALNFGVEGALPTGLLCMALSVPNIIVFHHHTDRVGVAVQLVLLVVLGTVVAARVDREHRAKQLTDAANQELAAAQNSLQAYIGLALRAEEDERHRISRELHDQTVQDLLVIQGLVRDLGRNGAEPDLLTRVDAALDGCVDGLRRICRALRPSILDDLGLAAALEWQTADLQARTGTQASFTVEGTPTRLAADTELAVFRIAQEALRNTERHADASHVQVYLDHRPTGTHLRVEDNGRGFDPTDVPEDRLGLTGMRERARMIGGRLHLRSRAHTTILCLDLPAHQPSTAADRAAITTTFTE